MPNAHCTQWQRFAPGFRGGLVERLPAPDHHSRTLRDGFPVIIANGFIQSITRRPELRRHIRRHKARETPNAPFRFHLYRYAIQRLQGVSDGLRLLHPCRTRHKPIPLPSCAI
jgi:hypothetical protein